MKNLRKYPQNILLLLVVLIACIVIIFLIKEYIPMNIIKTSKIQTDKLTLPSSARFKLNNSLILGSSSKPLAEEILEGSTKIALNSLNGDLKVDSIDIKSKIIKVKEIDKKIKILSVSLDSTHPSTGTFNQKTGKIDVSACIVLEMNIENKSNNNKISLIFPLTGKLNKKSDKMILEGEASLPPDVLGVPMPIRISALASSY
jgi:hypothetical protein